MMVSDSVVFFNTLLIFSLSFGFNIEVKFPVVKRGKLNSLFGFSVAGHQMQSHGEG